MTVNSTRDFIPPEPFEGQNYKPRYARPSASLREELVIRDSQVLAKLGVVTIFFIGWGQTARLQRVRQNTADRIQTETEQQQTARLQRVRQNTADRILKFDKRYKAFEIAGYFQKHREIIG